MKGISTNSSENVELNKSKRQKYTKGLAECRVRSFCHGHESSLEKKARASLVQLREINEWYVLSMCFDDSPW